MDITPLTNNVMTAWRQRRIYPLWLSLLRSSCVWHRGRATLCGYCHAGSGKKHSHESVHHSYLWLDSSQGKLVMRPALFYATAFWYRLILPTSPTSFSQTSFSTTLFIKSMAGVEDVSSCTCIYLSRLSSVVFCCVMRQMALHPSLR